jgi:Cof subfamily protein (haloacid dehalogenase superfamily)
MQPKIVFFDIDGTLIDFDASGISPAVVDALKRLQEKGTKLFLASGRPPILLPRSEGVTFDGALCFNGAYGFDQSGTVISAPIPKSDVKQMVRNGEQMGLPMLLAGAETIGSNFYQKNLEDYMTFAGHPHHVVSRTAYAKLMAGDVYQIMAGTTADQDAALLAGTSNVQPLRWWDRACDIVGKESDKALGAEKLLAAYGLPREACAAFGDGGNDKSLIAFAGTGIAMGNATDDVKAVADYVTTPCAEDGVAAALTHFGWIS